MDTTLENRIYLNTKRKYEGPRKKQLFFTNWGYTLPTNEIVEPNGGANARIRNTEGRTPNNPPPPYTFKAEKKTKEITRKH